MVSILFESNGWPRPRLARGSSLLSAIILQCNINGAAQRHDFVIKRWKVCCGGGQPASRPAIETGPSVHLSSFAWNRRVVKVVAMAVSDERRVVQLIAERGAVRFERGSRFRGKIDNCHDCTPSEAPTDRRLQRDSHSRRIRLFVAAGSGLT